MTPEEADNLNKSLEEAMREKERQRMTVKKVRRLLKEVDDWIIKGIKGEYYPCKPEIFAKTYEEDTDE